MKAQHRLKSFAVLLALGSLGCLGNIVAPLTLSFAETPNVELTPILLMEETARPAPDDSGSLEPPVPELDLEQTAPVSEIIPTKNFKEILSAENHAASSPTTADTAQSQTANSAPIQAPIQKPASNSCHYADQLNLTHNQRYRLKRWKATFVKDNQAAFDSIRIKRNLLKKLGKNPSSAREKQQMAELRGQIKQEWKALQTKREAQIAHVLTETQYDQWRTLRQECQPQASTQTPGTIFNRNPEEAQLKQTLRQSY